MSDLWDDDELALQSRRRRGNPWVGRIAVGLALTAFVGVVAWGALVLAGNDKSGKKHVVNITLLAPPPPPPPPPPEVKPPEPEIKQEVKVPEQEQPKQAEQAAPADDQLGLDAKGSGAGDGFGLAAKQGGTDITKLGGPTTDGAQYAWFAGQVQSFLQERLQKSDKLRKADYRIVLRVWFGKEGQLDRYEVIGSTGNPEIDKNLRLVLDDMPRFTQAPPADMPQPVKLRVTSRGAG